MHDVEGGELVFETEEIVNTGSYVCGDLSKIDVNEETQATKTDGLRYWDGCATF
ncbi:MAG: hypothetical protein ABSH09_00585 [Bryobacteraceae bacterium]|jgi:hypothetical protein